MLFPLYFWDKARWFLSLRVFGLLSSSLLLFPQCFGRYDLQPSSGVCRTREPEWFKFSLWFPIFPVPFPSPWELYQVHELQQVSQSPSHILEFFKFSGKVLVFVYLFDFFFFSPYCYYYLSVSKIIHFLHLIWSLFKLWKTIFKFTYFISLWIQRRHKALRFWRRGRERSCFNYEF